MCIYIYTCYYFENFSKIICIFVKGSLNVTVLLHIRKDARHSKKKIQSQRRRMRRAFSLKGREESILMGIIINVPAVAHISLSASTPAPYSSHWILMRVSGHCKPIITLQFTHIPEGSSKIQKMKSLFHDC